jgi:hypothetical protein
VVYVLLLGRTTAALLDGYSKSEKEDLTADELRAIIAVRDAVEVALKANRNTTSGGGT